MSITLEKAAQTRLRMIRETSEANRHALAQHLTPPEVATLAASMFCVQGRDLRCLDLGCGTGMLSVALYERFGQRIQKIDAIDADPSLADVYDSELRGLVDGRTFVGDALAPHYQWRSGYDVIILNPPYKKMAANDPRQALLPVRSPNLYAAFIMVAVSCLANNGEAVAIIPRSWMNGEYFAPFRRYVLDRCSLDAMHVYGSRDEIFSDTKVLQETMVVRFTRGKRQSDHILVGQTEIKNETAVVHEYPAESLITGPDRVVRIFPQEHTSRLGTVEGKRLCPSTGKVVDFRSREHILSEFVPGCDAVPLLYAGNFRSGTLRHPLSFGKGQWLIITDSLAERQLCMPGAYVVVKRFTAKEEKRRVVAYPLAVDRPVALENHLSFLHQGTPREVVPLRSKELAQGLSAWLNTTFVDDWFRGVSGSTQVNAGDIRKMPCPALDELELLGTKWHPGMTQEETDSLFQGVI